MSVQQAMIKIPVEQSPPSIGRDIFAQYAKGQLPLQEYLVATGVWTAESLSWYQPHRTKNLPDHVQRYVADRLRNATGYLPERARELSDWFRDALRTFDKNEADLRTLKWAREKCMEAKLLGHAEKCDRKIGEYEQTEFPAQEFDRASRVLRLDADERQAQERRGAS